MCHRAKFHYNLPNGLRDIAIFIFKVAVSAILDFQIYKFLVDRQIGIAVPNFTKIGQTFVEISHLTIFKMAAVRHLGFGNF